MAETVDRKAGSNCLSVFTPGAHFLCQTTSLYSDMHMYVCIFPNQSQTLTVEELFCSLIELFCQDINNNQSSHITHIVNVTCWQWAVRLLFVRFFSCKQPGKHYILACDLLCEFYHQGHQQCDSAEYECRHIKTTEEHRGNDYIMGGELLHVCSVIK